MNEPLNLSQFTRLRESLTIGDVVSVAFTISRERWKQNAGIALQATAWLFVPVIGGGILSALFMPVMSGVGRSARSGYAGVAVLVFVMWLVGALYCLGRYMANSALISRLAFNDLAQQSESLADAHRFTQSRTWSYLGASLLMGLLYSVVLIAFSIVFFIVIVLISLALGVSGSIFGPSSGFANNPVMGFFLVISVLLAFLGFLVGFTWFGSRLFFYEVPMSVERETGAAASIGRTWSLGNRSNWRLMLITTLAYLITLPLQAIAQGVILLSMIPQFALAPGGSASGGLTGISVLVNLLVNFFIVVATIVFWQTVKAVVYFDLRNQAEGMGLELR